MVGRYPSRPALHLVDSAAPEPAATSWFCGHCAAPGPAQAVLSPVSRVCSVCGFGVLLQTRADTVPGPDDAFLVVDRSLRIQALSREAENLLAVSEGEAVGRPVTDLVVPADAEAQRSGALAAVVHETLGDEQPTRLFVRPWKTFGIRMTAVVTVCGPPRAVLVVLGRAPRLHAI